jgi:hypothetical protein
MTSADADTNWGIPLSAPHRFLPFIPKAGERGVWTFVVPSGGLKVTPANLAEAIA